MGFDKIWAELAGQPVLAYSLRVLADAPAIDRVALVVSEERLAQARALVGTSQSRIVVCPGGELRRDSVAAGLAALGPCEWVVVHDAARPFLTAELLARGLRAAEATGAAVAAISTRDTIKRVAGEVVVETLPRDELRAIQTPQVFRQELLQRALARADADVTDEATLVERLGGTVCVFPGDEANWKITTPIDFQLAAAWLAERQQPRLAAPAR
jgi:2-C-methyl-D-erythritol 4-phosphate cytidylyltransferase